MIQQLQAADLEAWLQDTARPQPLLIDVRESWEHELVAIPQARHIPMARIPIHLSELPDEQAIVLICHHGVRSQHAAQFLAENGFETLYNLSGGIDAWSEQVDPTLARY